jgi:hypothetical protein
MNTMVVRRITASVTVSSHQLLSIKLFCQLLSVFVDGYIVWLEPAVNILAVT